MSLFKKRRTYKSGGMVIFAVISLILVLAVAMLLLIREYISEEDDLPTQVEKLTTLSGAELGGWKRFDRRI